MPLNNLVRHLNRQNRHLNPGFNEQEPFLLTEHGVLARFADFHIESLIFPYSDDRGKLHGHAADIRAYGAVSRQALDSKTLFMLAHSTEEFIYLDRLLRTLHILNYLHLHLDDTLLLKLHPRLAITAAAHRGLGFDEILQACQLIPERIGFEFDMNDVGTLASLQQATAIYRARGYGIVLAGFESRPQGAAELRQLHPDIVRLDARISRTPGELLALSKSIGAAGGKSLASGLAVSRETANRCSIDLLQAPKALLPLMADAPDAQALAASEYHQRGHPR